MGFPLGFRRALRKRKPFSVGEAVKPGEGWVSSSPRTAAQARDFWTLNTGHPKSPGAHGLELWIAGMLVTLDPTSLELPE